MREEGKLASNRFKGSALGEIPLFIPPQYVLGIDEQKFDFEKGRQCYLMGKWRTQGEWYYYVLAFVLKEPFGLICMIVLALIETRILPRLISPIETLLGIFSLFVIVLISSQTGLQAHFRYALPAFPFVFLFASRCMILNKGAAILGCAFLFWYTLSSAAVLPRSYSFFSEIVGGGTEGWKYLDDSNLDWGQDLFTLLDWIEENPDMRPVYVYYGGNIPNNLGYDFVLMDARSSISQYNDSIPREPSEPGWHVVFARQIVKPYMSWFRTTTPDYYLSPTIRVYKVEIAPGTGLDVPSR